MRINIKLCNYFHPNLITTFGIGRAVKITVGFTDKYVLYRKHTKEKRERKKRSLNFYSLIELSLMK